MSENKNIKEQKMECFSYVLYMTGGIRYIKHSLLACHAIPDAEIQENNKINQVEDVKSQIS